MNSKNRFGNCLHMFRLCSEAAAIQHKIEYSCLLKSLRLIVQSTKVIREELLIVLKGVKNEEEEKNWNEKFDQMNAKIIYNRRKKRKHILLFLNYFPILFALYLAPLTAKCEPWKYRLKTQRNLFFQWERNVEDLTRKKYRIENNEFVIYTK